MKKFSHTGGVLGRRKRALDRLKSAGRLRDSGQTSIFDF